MPILWKLLPLLLSSGFAAGPTVPQVEAITEKIGELNGFCTQAQKKDCTIRASIPIPEPRPVPDDATQPQDSPKTFEKMTINDENGNPVTLSVIPEDQLGKIRANLKTEQRVFDECVCSQRSHVVGDELAKAGIETGKIFAEPYSGWASYFASYKIYGDEKVRTSSGRVRGWNYHAANLLLVKKKDGSIHKYVYDSFLESKPVPLEYWESRLRKNPNSSVDTISISNRFTLQPNDRWYPRTGYDEGEIQRSYQVMRGELGSPCDY